MTESEWFSCTNPHDMLAFLREDQPSRFASVLARFGLGKRRASKRKLVLFACACCRRLWPLLADECCRQAIESTELFTEGLIGKKALQQAVALARAASLKASQPRIVAGGWLAAAQAQAAETVTRSLEAEDPADEAATWAKEAVRAWASRKPATTAMEPIRTPRLTHQTMSPEAAWVAEGIAQCDLLRDLIGNPFRPPALDAAWRTPQAVALATTIFKDRAFNSLPQLADILELAGCKNRDILQHCRDEREHARGCWALDLVLGKS
jgi:hypothetical protein